MLCRMKLIKNVGSRCCAVIVVCVMLLGCSTPLQTQESTLAAEAAHAPTPAREVTVPDRSLLLQISEKAIATRLPSVPFDSLELSTLAYWYSVDDLDRFTSEHFYVGFRVKGSSREVIEEGETVFKIDTVGVDIELDGKINERGIRRGTETFRSPDMKAEDCVSIEGGPGWGDSFCPMPINGLLPKPDRENLKRIALQAIGWFLPSVDTSDLELRNASFVDVRRPEEETERPAFWLTFWAVGSVQKIETVRETKIKYEEFSVQIEENGQVLPEGVTRSPRESTHYKNEPLPFDPDAPSLLPSGRAIDVPLGRFFLLKSGNRFGAVRILRNTPDDGAEYEWHYQGDGSGDFSKRDCLRGRGKVFERYERVKKRTDGWEVKDVGSELHIKCGDLSVQWSLSNWIYVNPNVDVAVTEATSIEDVDVFDEKLEWIEYGEGE